jgi:hypothetical protein
MFYVGYGGAMGIGESNGCPLARYIDNLDNINATP